MALKDKILMVSIYPSHTETPLNVPDVEKRVDAFVERLRKVSEQEVRPSAPLQLHISVIPAQRPFADASTLGCHHRI